MTHFPRRPIWRIVTASAGLLLVLLGLPALAQAATWYARVALGLGVVAGFVIISFAAKAHDGSSSP